MENFFFVFDEGKLVVLLHESAKKTQKTPRKEIAKAEKLMQEYYKEKKDKS
jgi:phage-related protein